MILAGRIAGRFMFALCRMNRHGSFGASVNASSVQLRPSYRSAFWRRSYRAAEGRKDMIGQGLSRPT